MTQAPTPGPLSGDDVKLLVKGDWLLVAEGGKSLSGVARVVEKPADTSELCICFEIEGQCDWTTSPHVTFLGRPDDAFGWIKTPSKDIPRDLVDVSYHVFSDLSGSDDAIMWWRPASLAPTARVEASGSEREYSDAEIESAAQALVNHRWNGTQPGFDRKPPSWKAEHVSEVRAVLAALRPQPSGETREVARRLEDLAATLKKQARAAAESNSMGTNYWEPSDRLAQVALDAAAILSASPAPVASGGQHSSGEGGRSPDALCSCFGDSGLQASTHHDADDKERCDLCGGLVEAPVAETAGEAVGEGVARERIEKIIKANVRSYGRGGALTFTGVENAAKVILAAYPSPPVPAQDDDKLRIAVEAIAAERQRQVEVEGWSEGHDDEHDDYQMARAAACYALNAGKDRTDEDFFDSVSNAAIHHSWPWDRSWWKPKDRRSDLVRAGALIVAEIERLDRAALKSTAAQEGGE